MRRGGGLSDVFSDFWVLHLFCRGWMGGGTGGVMGVKQGWNVLIRRHETVAGLGALLDFRVLHLHKSNSNSDKESGII
jgi:hypothetical protein